MSETPRCDDTTSENTPNTLRPEAIGKQPGSGKKIKSKPSALQRTGVLEGHFSLEDLSRLIFQLTEAGPSLDCWQASAQDFQTYVQQFADTESVNTELWPLGERLYLINHVWEECEAHSCLHLFPFTINKILTQETESC